ncbi:MAG: zinc metallopeptidase [Clostridiales bacterium]|nr:zinc metallopeptidase [Candidatus Blautia equi]
MYGYRYGFGLDPTYLLIIIGMLITMAAQGILKSTVAANKKRRSASGLRGQDVAQRVLHAAGITDVQIVAVGGSLTDHYDPRSKRVCLSEDVFNSTSLVAIGVAAHECGHAIQHHKGYVPLSFRSTIVPVANIGSQLSWPLFLAGLILSFRPLLLAGIILFSLAVLFQLVTLPVEFNASSRALQMLEGLGIVGADEKSSVRKVLTAAALTYVASLAASLLQLLRLIMLAGGGRRRRG